MTKPILFLDVDGPLYPYAAKPTRRPEGYITKRLSITRTEPDAPTMYQWADKGERVWLNPAHGPMLLTLADRFELVWASSWMSVANDLIGPVIGLPKLPVVNVGMPPFFRDKHIWKLQAVSDYAGERPFAWIDDDFREPYDFQWEVDRSRYIAPTLFVAIDPQIGLLQDDLDEIAAWGETLRAAT